MSDSELQERLSSRVASSIVNLYVGSDRPKRDLHVCIQAVIRTALWEMADRERRFRFLQPTEN